MALALALLFAGPAKAAGIAALPDNLIVLTIVTAALSFGLAGGLWALAQQQRVLAAKRALRVTAGRARALIAAREAWLSSGREALIVWDSQTSVPLSFSGGAELIEACLVGPDAAELSIALDALAVSGIAFTQSARTQDGGLVQLRGRPAGGAAAIFLERATQAQIQGAEYKTVLDALPIPVWRRGADLALTFVNRAFLTATGASSEEIALSANVALDRAERDLAANARTGKEIVEAKRFAVLGGRRCALSLTLAPLPDGGVVGSAIDVTALNEAEARLNRHAEAHADTLDRLATAVAIFDAGRKLGFYNRAYERLWELPKSFLDTNPSEGDILDRLRDLRRLPEQSDFRAWKQNRLDLFDTSKQPSEDQWHLPGGKTLRVVTQPHPLGGLTILYEDVSDRLLLESRYNTLIKVQKATLDTLQEGVAVFGPDGRLKLYNAAFSRIWNLDPADLLGEPHLNRIAEICTARFGEGGVWENVLSAIALAAPEWRREWGQTGRSDGKVIALSLAPLPDGATLASFTDVTGRSRTETALRERNQALEESDRLKSEFVKRVSHELRTPLNSIVGFTELLRSGTAGQLNPRQTGYVDAVLQASSGVRDLIDDVLDLAQLESGAAKLELETIDLFSLLSGLVESAREWARNLEVTLTLDCRPDAGSLIADGRRLKQVAFNLLSHTFKHTAKGGHIVLGGDITGDEVLIYVAETPHRAPYETAPTAPEPHAAKGNEGAGAALGLTIVNRFIELHGGWLEIHSTAGQGFKVICHLPRVPDGPRQTYEAGRASA